MKCNPVDVYEKSLIKVGQLSIECTIQKYIRYTIQLIKGVRIKIINTIIFTDEGE